MDIFLPSGQIFSLSIIIFPGNLNFIFWVKKNNARNRAHLKKLKIDVNMTANRAAPQPDPRADPKEKGKNEEKIVWTPLLFCWSFLLRLVELQVPVLHLSLVPVSRYFRTCYIRTG